MGGHHLSSEALSIINYSKLAYNDIYHERTGKSVALPLRGLHPRDHVLKNLRYQQIIVLKFASYHMFITPAQVRAWVKSKYQVELNNKKIWDSINSLIKRGILYKETTGKRKGVYKLTELGRLLLVFVNSIPDEAIKDMLINRKFSIEKAVARKVNREIDPPRGVGVGVGVGGVLRVHGFAGGVGFEGLVFEAWLLWRVGGFLLGFLRRVYGGGRVGRLVRLFDGGVGFDGRVVVGGHGVGGGCDRVLSPVDVFSGFPFRLEMGFDVGVVFKDGFEPPVRFVKVYFSRRDFIREYGERVARRVRLTDFLRGG